MQLIVNAARPGSHYANLARKPTGGWTVQQTDNLGAHGTVYMTDTRAEALALAEQISRQFGERYGQCAPILDYTVPVSGRPAIWTPEG